MKQGSYAKRPRGRGNPRRGGSSGSRGGNIESNGPDGKVRGNANQVLEKYQALARDAALSGDRIAAESYYQFAEHYLRVANAAAGNNGSPNTQQQKSQSPSGMANNGSDEGFDDGSDEVAGQAGTAAAAPKERSPRQGGRNKGANNKNDAAHLSSEGEAKVIPIKTAAGGAGEEPLEASSVKPDIKDGES